MIELGIFWFEILMRVLNWNCFYICSVRHTILKVIYFIATCATAIVLLDGTGLFWIQIRYFHFLLRKISCKSHCFFELRWRIFYGTLFYYTPLHLNFAKIITIRLRWLRAVRTGYHQEKKFMYKESRVHRIT